MWKCYFKHLYKTLSAIIAFVLQVHYLVDNTPLLSLINYRKYYKLRLIRSMKMHKSRARMNETSRYIDK